MLRQIEDEMGACVYTSVHKSRFRLRQVLKQRLQAQAVVTFLLYRSAHQGSTGLSCKVLE